MQVESALRKEKSSQAIVAEFSQALASATDMNSLGKQMNLASEQATTLSFSSNTIPGGFEPNVVGAFYGVKKGQLSAPIIGNSGVYVVSPSDLKDSQVPKEYSSLKKQLEAQLQPRANFEVFNALKAMSDIEDNRVKFY
jgi:peptidyl-prolyl cis-trans isomerase D